MEIEIEIKITTTVIKKELKYSEMPKDVTQIK